MIEVKLVIPEAPPNVHITVDMETAKALKDLAGMGSRDLAGNFGSKCWPALERVQKQCVWNALALAGVGG